MRLPCPSLPQINNAIRRGCLANKQSVIVGCRKNFFCHISENGGSSSVRLICANPCSCQGQMGGKWSTLRAVLRDAVRLLVMLSLAASFRGLNLINTEYVSRPALHVGCWTTACQIFLNIHEKTLQACSQLDGPHEAAAFHSLRFLLFLELLLDDFGPGQMPSCIMTLKDNFS